jgi:hypothetical protein
MIFRGVKCPSWKRTQHAPQVLPQSNLYHTCSKLPMACFLSVLCDDDIKALIITGNASNEELNEAWMLILAEYYELRGDTIDTVDQWTLSRDILRLQNHLQLLDKCVQFLSKGYSESIAESVRRLGYQFKPVSYEPDNYIELLEQIVNKSKTKYIQLKQFIKQLEKKMLEGGKEKPKRDYFENMIIHIEEMQGATYNLDELSVSKYVLLEKKYWQKVELIKKANGKH